MIFNAGKISINPLHSKLFVLILITHSNYAINVNVAHFPTVIKFIYINTTYTYNDENISILKYQYFMQLVKNFIFNKQMLYK